jgi:hypothetical protein
VVRTGDVLLAVPQVILNVAPDYDLVQVSPKSEVPIVVLDHLGRVRRTISGERSGLLAFDGIDAVGREVYFVAYPNPLRIHRDSRFNAVLGVMKPDGAVQRTTQILLNIDQERTCVLAPLVNTYIVASGDRIYVFDAVTMTLANGRTLAPRLLVYDHALNFVSEKSLLVPEGPDSITQDVRLIGNSNVHYVIQALDDGTNIYTFPAGECLAVVPRDAGLRQWIGGAVDCEGRLVLVGECGVAVVAMNASSTAADDD